MTMHTAPERQVDLALPAPAANSTTDRWVEALVLLVVTYTVFVSTWEALGRPLWFDEVFTATLTGLPSFAEVTEALRQAVDTPGPGYYLIQRLASTAVADEHVALRLASIVSLPITCLCIFWFARDETGSVSAAAGALLPLLGRFYHGYSVEARPYGVMVALIALACLAWKRSSRSWGWGLTMIGALAVASLVNYYAVFVLVPFTLAEATRTIRTGRPTVAAWVAIGAGLVPVLIHWSTLNHLRTYYGEYYWSKPSLAKAAGTYDFVLSAGTTGTGFGLAAVLGLALLAVCVFKVATGTDRERPALSSLVLVIGLLSLPFVAVGITGLMQGGYHYRYALGVIVGLALALSFALPFVGGRSPSAVLICLVGALVAHDALFWISGGRVGPDHPSAARSLQALVSRLGWTHLPVVVLNGMDYLPLDHYADPALRTRLVTLIHLDASRESTGSDSVDLDLLKLRDWREIRVERFEEFIANHDQFLVIVTPGTNHWWLPRLSDSSFAAELLASEGSAFVYLAERRGPLRAHPRRAACSPNRRARKRSTVLQRRKRRHPCDGGRLQVTP